MPILFLSLHCVHSRLGSGVWSLSQNLDVKLSLSCSPDVWIEVCGSNRLRIGLEAVEEFCQQRIRPLFCRLVPLAWQLVDRLLLLSFQCSTHTAAWRWRLLFQYVSDGLHMSISTWWNSCGLSAANRFSTSPVKHNY